MTLADADKICKCGYLVTKFVNDATDTLHNNPSYGLNAMGPFCL